MSNEIQKARDVLAKWRAEATPGPLVYDRGDLISQHPEHDGVAAYVSRNDARLIVGTAGNPELLDAIDEMLGDVSANPLYPSHHAERIAAGIIAADERMRA